MYKTSSIVRDSIVAVVIAAAVCLVLANAGVFDRPASEHTFFGGQL